MKSKLGNLILSASLIGCGGPKTLNQLSDHEGYQQNGEVIACAKNTAFSRQRALMLAAFREGTFKVINNFGEYELKFKHNLTGSKVTKRVYGDQEVCTQLKTSEFKDNLSPKNEIEFKTKSCTENTGNAIKDLHTAIIKGTTSNGNSIEKIKIENIKHTSQELCVDIMKIIN